MPRFSYEVTTTKQYGVGSLPFIQNSKIIALLELNRERILEMAPPQTDAYGHFKDGQMNKSAMHAHSHANANAYERQRTHASINATLSNGSVFHALFPFVACIFSLLWFVTLVCFTSNKDITLHFITIKNIL